MTSIVHGTASGIQGGNTLVGSAEFAEFAPLCFGFNWLNSKFAQARTFFRVYDNRIEGNFPIAPCMCLTCTEQCINDRSYLAFYDRHPFRSTYVCGLFPLNIFGPPVIFVKKSVCCFFFDLSPYCGSNIRFSPCNCYGIGYMFCCGSCCGPCYEGFSYPLLSGLTPDSAPAILGTLQSAVQVCYTVYIQYVCALYYALCCLCVIYMLYI